MSTPLLNIHISVMAKKIATFPLYKELLTESSVMSSQLFFKIDGEGYYLVDFFTQEVMLTDDDKQVINKNISTPEASILYDSLCEFLNQSARYIYRSHIYDFFKIEFGIGVPTPKPQKESEIYLDCSLKYYTKRLDILLLTNRKNVVPGEPLFVYETETDLVKIYFSDKNKRAYSVHEVVGSNTTYDPFTSKQKHRDALKQIFENWIQLKNI